MPSFTIELNDVLELTHDPGLNDWNSPAAGGTIGLGLYPIFTDNHEGIPTHRTELNRKIIRRYWNREIAYETISKFTLALERRMDEIMPYFNQLYESQLIEFEPLATFGLTTTRNDSGKSTSDVTTESSADNTSSSASRSQSSDTPQNPLPDGWEEDADYASTGSASQANSKGNATTTGTNTGTGTTDATGTSTTTGFQGSAADLLGKFRAQIINIDTAILENLNDLFMGVWDSGNEFRAPYYYQPGLPSLNL